MRDAVRPSAVARVIWINGAFGAGKTTSARLLAHAIPGSVILDTEEIGSMLRLVLQPVAPVLDFQQWMAWRVLVADVINAVVDELPPDGPRTIIIPQTITEHSYWAQIRAAVRREVEIVPVSLHVTSDEHRCRVEADVEEPEAMPWRLAKFENFRSADWIADEFELIESTGRAPSDVAGAIRAFVSSKFSS